MDNSISGLYIILQISYMCLLCVCYNFIVFNIQHFTWSFFFDAQTDLKNYLSFWLPLSLHHFFHFCIIIPIHHIHSNGSITVGIQFLAFFSWYKPRYSPTHIIFHLIFCYLELSVLICTSAGVSLSVLLESCIFLFIKPNVLLPP